MDMSGGAEGPAQQATEQEQDTDPERVKNILPIYGSSSTFNINTLLFNNIMEADYFKALYQLRTYHEIVGTSSSIHDVKSIHSCIIFLSHLVPSYNRITIH